MSVLIDNPGGGDCGFYAFAIGLVSIIQRENHVEKMSGTFKRLQKTGFLKLNIREILAIDLSELEKKPRRYQKENLFSLQMSLRKIAVHANQKDFLLKIEEQKKQPALSKVEGSVMGMYFFEIVEFFLSTSNVKLDSRYNGLFLSDRICNEAKKIAEFLKTNNKERTDAEREQFKNCHVRNWIMGHASLILEGGKYLEKEGRWATHSDLKEVADSLEVQLLVKGVNNGETANNRPIITLVNRRNCHWTTVVASDCLEPALRAQCSLDSQTTRLKRSVKRLIKNNNPAGDDTALPNSLLLKNSDSLLTAKMQKVIKSTNNVHIKNHLHELFEAVLEKGLFSNVRTIDSKNIDSAEARIYSNGTTETDFEFAVSLQEAELRKAGLKFN